ncbi:unnamed protein product [Diabrotica balteata]|uniref:pyridoxal kinase n=1 Tax=Diabrotica balteata TaxID=107213 RepID=A0A9N9T6V0_DIABA|nr:unnamed protein product [Diabrotica balteata]
MPETSARVLSIQSHVVSGYVGNKSAVFPMQLLGIEVDFINSVQFSNHTGYKAFKGQILTENDLTDLVDGLSANDIDVYSHLLTGYIGSESFLKNIIKVVQHLKQKNPGLVYGENKEKYCLEIPKLPIAFTGSGDLFAALILSWMHISNSNLKQSLENTIASLHAVLKRTLEATQGKPLTAFNTELKLLQSKRDIEEPIVSFKATRVL